MGTFAQAKADVFKALGHSTRLAIVEMLAAGELCVCEIVQEFTSSQATISRHLDVLLRAGVVSRRKEGARMMYDLAVPCVLKVIPCVVEAIRKRPAVKAGPSPSSRRHAG